MPVSSVYILKFDVDGGNSEPWGFIDGDVAVYFFSTNIGAALLDHLLNVVIVRMIRGFIGGFTILLVAIQYSQVSQSRRFKEAW